MTVANNSSNTAQPENSINSFTISYIAQGAKTIPCSQIKVKCIQRFMSGNNNQQIFVVSKSLITPLQISKYIPQIPIYVLRTISKKPTTEPAISINSNVKYKLKLKKKGKPHKASKYVLKKSEESERKKGRKN